ncbi:MAG: ribosome maturation factor RimP [Alphaproteobacteria bacterium]|nr:ribosome maturation factor RimP [Alphaproteobacteria bacterium]MCW5752378.1 ribosome maturation factor RimP [Alphaproteobacteria bacterium]
MDATSRVAELIQPALQSMGFDLVRVRLMGGQRPVLQVMAERPDGSMSVDDCAEVSRVVSALLDVEDPISGPYRLEVSSPGIDRPLVRPADYERFRGFEVRLETRQPIEGRKRFRGRLVGLQDEEVRLATETGEVAIPLPEIGQAKLVLTDELIALAMKGRN